MQTKTAAVVVLLAVVLFAQFSFATTLQVQESSLRVKMQPETLSVSVPVTSTVALAAVMKIELLDPVDKVVAVADIAANLKPGPNKVELSLPCKVASYKELPWYRIHYVFAGDDGKPLMDGIVSVGAAVQDLFDIRIFHDRFVSEGKTLTVRVQAFNPVTSAPASGVRVKVSLKFDDDDSGDETSKAVIPVAAVTNSSGDAVVRVRVPKQVKGEEGEVEIEAGNDHQLKSKSFTVKINNFGNIIINTDKTLYQPGQSFHARALAMDVYKKVIAETEISFELRDPDNTVVFRAEAKTNKFGIASVDWNLPESLRLGDYTFQAHASASERYSDLVRYSTVRVSRYDLPEFTVTAKADKSYYLPAQDAEVDISGTYLFGKPVIHGSVRLVQENERHWNYDKQKWDIEEGSEQKGQLDANGHAKFAIDLKEHHANFEENAYRRYEDLDYTAYITDQTTSKTEQRRFKLRISGSPIHVYVSNWTVLGKEASFYLSTAYPDGTPAPCTVDIKQRVEETRPEDTSKGLLPLRSVKTNRYGVAKVSGLRLLLDEDSNSREGFVFVAQDARGAYATYEDELEVEPSKQILQITTDRALYRKGDPILISLRSEPLPGTIVVSAVVDGVPVWSTTTSLRRGKATLVLPYQSAFLGDVVIAAYATGGDFSEWNLPRGVRTVLYPHDDELRVSIKTDHSSYKPGEPLTASLRATSVDGSGDLTALGVVVVDKAVEERARTNEEFGSRSHGFWDWSWWYGDTNIAGYSRQSLNKIDVTEPVPYDLDLLAEVLLRSSDWYEWESVPEVETAQDYRSTERSLYSNRIIVQLRTLEQAILDTSAGNWKFPTNEAELDTLLRAAKIERSELRDPWHENFKFEFSFDQQSRYVRMISAGPDKRFGTEDDTAHQARWNHFEGTGAAIVLELPRAYARSGVILSDYDSLRKELLSSQGVDLDSVRDPWGNTYVYRFAVFGSYDRVDVFSHGTSTRPSPETDLLVWTANIDYFTVARNRLDEAMQTSQKATGFLPHNDEEFEKALNAGGFSTFRNFVDPWGHPFRIAYWQSYQYGDYTRIRATGEATTPTITPSTQKLGWVLINSSGPDGKPNTEDDVTMARFSQIVSEQIASAADVKPVASPALSGAVGAIEGTVVDQTGAAIPNATVTAEEENASLAFTAQTDDRGGFSLRVMPGTYRVKITARGFKDSLYVRVAVHAQSITRLESVLSVGSATETVTVEANAVAVQTETNCVSMPVEKKGTAARGRVQEEIFTPRLRDYFPETLYWEPSLITNRSGSAKINFRLADNITTWKMSVLASTADGRIGVADTEIQAFQPFFVALDPPKVLTVGDQIELPVTVRNYLPKAQSVQIEMKSAEWFKLLNPGKQTITVPTADSTNALFPFMTLLPVKDGKQQVLAANRSTGDAIEKPVNVHPDGQEESRTASVLLAGSGPFSLELPTEIMPSSLHAELKIYPNLLSHVGEGIEASLQRPHGCGEQTISSTYPSVLLLKYYKEAGLPDSELSRRAKKYLSLGYQRLLNYKTDKGGFSYWGRGEADIALTAYAVRFLMDASALIDIDREVISDAQSWLISAQSLKGDWNPHYGYNQGTTAYVARVLALSLNSTNDEKLKTNIKDAVAKALKKLDDPHDPMMEPYTLSMYALAAAETGAKEQADAAVAKLGMLAHKEGNTTYWSLETNTPFYGWGRAGRVESTALAIQALSHVAEQSGTTKSQIASGMLFLLKEKDRYGVWYSGQATVTVFQTMLGILADSPSANTASTAAVTINDKAVGALQLPQSAAAGPVQLDISQYLRPGANTISLDRAEGSAFASVQAVATYYVPWKQDSDVREITRLGESRALRLSVKFDKSEAKVGDTVQCSVNAERIGHYGYGMLLAEIGLPPGADVDRASLEKAVDASGWDVSRYDVLPDRVILYLWPRAGGTKVEFTFRPRFGMKARSSQSVLYDYYNPDEQVTLAPVDFNVSSEEPKQRARGSSGSGMLGE